MLILYNIIIYNELTIHIKQSGGIHTTEQGSNLIATIVVITILIAVFLYGHSQKLKYSGQSNNDTSTTTELLSDFD